MKPGWRTSEFWLVVAALALAAGGLIENPTIAIVAGIYAGSRGIAKHGRRHDNGSRPWWSSPIPEEDR